MASKIRGTVEFKIGDKSYPCAMTIGALAELAEAVGADTFDEISDRLSKVSPTVVPKVVRAILVGNGHDVDQALINRLTLKDAMSSLTEIMASAGDAAPSTDKAKPSPPKAAA